MEVASQGSGRRVSNPGRMHRIRSEWAPGPLTVASQRTSLVPPTWRLLAVVEEGDDGVTVNDDEVLAIAGQCGRSSAS